MGGWDHLPGDSRQPAGRERCISARSAPGPTLLAPFSDQRRIAVGGIVGDLVADPIGQGELGVRRFQFAFGQYQPGMVAAKFVYGRNKQCAKSERSETRPFRMRLLRVSLGCRGREILAEVLSSF